ncbi:MAG: hypothetical protein K2P88_06960 [Chitinophagaceae bacterium]|uniref:hypothetical protein n=1 Tax=unclassified Paraflavitalea TaxID=2798305 RepID=UPI003D339616|nr:hypothetical protein [Chitinophagaceae bacterium]
MKQLPVVYEISKDDFSRVEGVNKIIVHDVNLNHIYFELNGRKYYVGYFSPIIKVSLMLLEIDNYLLVGVDLRVVVLCIKTGRILFSIGLYSFFKGFENTSEFAFTIFSELEDIVVNKNGLSISQIIPHELEF